MIQTLKDLKRQSSLTTHEYEHQRESEYAELEILRRSLDSYETENNTLKNQVSDLNVRLTSKI